MLMPVCWFSKLSGLQKAIYQIESALLNEGPSSQQDRELLNQFLDKIGSEAPTPLVAKSPVETRNQVQLDAMQSARPIQPRQPTRQGQWPSLLAKSGTREAINGAESPLLLIAQAPKELSVEARPAAFGHRLNARSRTSSSNYEIFFGPFQPMLDTQPDLDPIELGLIDMDQAENLFSYFYQNLSEMRWGLDPALHSAAFVHKRSHFLFTSILAVTTLFVPSAGTSSKRLRLHCRKVADVVITKRLRSVEIILAFMVNVPWLTPGTHWADDETWMYLTAASSIALDLSLDKIILHPGTTKAVLEWSQTHQAECVDVQKVMDMDGFSNVDVTSEWGRRLIRRRERAWLTLWGLERGVCLARGRRWSVPVTPLIDFCDKWHVSDIAAPWDDSIAPAMVLRRDLLPSIEKLKASVLGRVADEPLHDSSLKLQ
ncbi:hypothetical protein SPI_06246 [Niveomyces insectorum RCEF 264]|uniref:Transcription factor n=1 Tax=Niveomyces insectorum RCEF 264 TaxID=1081102 RepID=A0A167RXV6_9HYPO|nr:hypothetical protein SPI_06246 [Niveomyces insectorum RCEF 264]